MTHIEPRFLNYLRYLLISQWDPVGIAHEPAAYSEYDIYIPRILSALVHSGESTSIADLLDQIEADTMRLPSNHKRAAATAHAISAAYNRYQNRITLPCYTRVRIITDRYRNEHAPLGTSGYIIEIHTPYAYEIECSGDDGTTFAQIVVHPDEIVPDEISDENQRDDAK
jgi:hypothetical protein